MIFFSLLVLFYFLPTFLAAHRGHEVAAVFLINLLFGWTVIGWFALLLWALLSTPCYYRVYQAPGPYYPHEYWRR